MAKINRTVLAIKEALAYGDITPDKGKRTSKRTTAFLLRLFSIVDDVRIQKLIVYPLEYIILIAFLAVLGSADTWQDIADFAEAKAAWLQKFIDVKKYGIPSHDTFRRVFGLIETTQLQDIIINILIENISRIRNSLHIDANESDYRLLCIDGKEENGTGRKYCASHDGKVRNTQTLHVYDATNMVCLASEPIDKKTNEIPTAQKILRTMDLKYTVCTFDALHMQKETLSIIRAQEGHYVGGLKGNQQGLMEEAVSCFTDEICVKLEKSRKVKKPVYIKTQEHTHGQEETREYYIVAAPENKDRAEKWKDLVSFILCKKTMMPDDPEKEKKIEFRYYASDLDDLNVISEAIRLHWSVEEFHWQLDYSFKEDDNSTMDVTAYENLSLLIKMSLHLIQLMKTRSKNVSVRRYRKRFAWNFEDTLEELLMFFDDEALIKVLSDKETESSKKGDSASISQ